MLAHVLTMTGDVATARTLHLEALITAREVGSQRRLAFALWTVAALVVAEGEPERAVRLDAAASAAAEAIGTVLTPPVRELYDALLAPAHHALGEDRVAAARAAGRAMTLEQAVDEALTWLTGPDELTELAFGTMIDDPRPDGHARRQAAAPAAAPAHGWGVDALTRREREVAVLLGRGLSNRQIAAELVLTEGTANSYVKRVLRRLDLHNRSQVAAWAVEHGLHTLQPGS